MSRRTEEREPRTIKKDLETGRGLTPAVRSEGLQSFNYARPGEVAYDRSAGLAGQGLRHLAQSLSSIEPKLHYAATKKLDVDIAEGKAEASIFAITNPEAVANMEAWRKACESDPAVRNISPWVKKFITQEVLRGEQLQMDTEMNDAFVTSGMVNERDPNKVDAWGRSFQKEFMTRRGLDKFEDKLTLGEHFTLPATRALSELMRRHNHNVESQNANILEQQMFQNLSHILEGKMNPLAGGYNTRLPGERSRYVSEAAPLIVAEAEKMKALGYGQDKIVGLIAKAVLHGNHSAAVAEGLAKSITVNVGGKDVNLMSQPGVAKGLEQLKDTEIARVRAAENHAWIQRERARAEAARMAGMDGLAYGADNADLSYATLVGGKIVAPEHYTSFVAMAKAAQAGNFRSPDASPALAAELLGFEADVRLGIKGKADIQDGLRSGLYDWKTAEKLMGLYDSARKESGQAEGVAAANVAEVVMSLNFGMEQAQAKSLYNDAMGGADLSPEKAKAWSVGLEAQRAFLSYVDEQKTKRAEKDASFTATDYDRMKREFLSSYTPKIVDAKKETQAAIDTGKTFETKAASIVNPVDVTHTTTGNTRLYQPANEAEEQQVNMWSNSIAAFNTLFPDVQYRDPGFGAALADLIDNGLRSPTISNVGDLLNLAHSIRGGSLPWQDTFFIVTGARPDKVGVLSMQQAKKYLDNYFKPIKQEKK